MQTLALIEGDFSMVALALVKKLIATGSLVELKTFSRKAWIQDAPPQILSHLVFTEGDRYKYDYHFAFNDSPDTDNVNAVKKITISNYNEGKSTNVILGDVYGPGIALNLNSPLSSMLHSAAFSESILYPTKDLKIHPIFVDDAAEEILKIALGLAQQKSVLVGNNQNSTEVAEILSKISQKPTLKTTREFMYDEREFSPPEKNSFNTLKLTLESITTQGPESGRQEYFLNIDSGKSNKSKKNLKHKKRIEFFLGGATFALSIWLFPFLFLAFSLVVNVLAKENTSFLQLAKLSAQIGEIYGSVSPLHEEKLLLASKKLSGAEISGLNGRGLLVSLLSSNIAPGADLLSKLNEAKFVYSNYYINAAFAQGELKKLPTIEKHFTDVLAKKDQALLLSDKLGQLSSILEKENSTILLVLQDSTMPMPSGGKITKFIVTKFEKGIFKSAESYTTEDLEEKLYGSAEPPQALKDLKRVDTWQIEDSNWEPNLEANIQRIAWFFDKTTGAKIENIIFINAQTKNYIKAETIENALLDNVQNKNIQIAQSPINTNVAGLTNSGCENCVKAKLRLTEASILSSPIEIQRIGTISSEAVDGKAKIYLSMTYLNRSDSEQYKAYLRLGIPQNSTFEDDRVKVSGSQIDRLTPITLEETNEFKYGGVLLTLDPNSTQTIVFSVEAPTKADEKKISLSWLSQSGLSISKLSVKNGIFLTSGTNILYNTSLHGDQELELNLTQ